MPGCGTSRGPRGRKRRAGNLGGDQNRQRLPRRWQQAQSNVDVPMDDSPQLTVGGITLHCQGDEVTHVSTAGRKQGKQNKAGLGPRRHQRAARAQSDADSDAVLQDFLDNLVEHGEDGGSDAEDHLLATVNMLRAHSAPEAELDDFALYPDVQMQSGVLGLEQFDPRDQSSGAAASDESSSDAYDSDPTDPTTDINSDPPPGRSQLDPPESAWPVQLPGQHALPSAQALRQRHGRGPARGACGGRLAPGEKARLKRERVMSKRAARAAHTGVDLRRVSQELHDFVMAGGDLKAFAPMNAYAMGRTQRLASLYGLKCSQQGSGKRRFVLVSATRTMALPQGDARQQLEDIIAFQQAAVAATRPANIAGGTGARPSAKGHRQSRRESQREGGGAREPGYQKPVGFVSSGVMMDDGEVVQMMARATLADDVAMQDAEAARCEIQPAPLQLGEDERDGAWPAVSLGAGLGASASSLTRSPLCTPLNSHASLPTSSSGGLPGTPASSLGRLPGGQLAGSVGAESESLSSMPSPLTPGALTTKKQHRNALKKQDKLARRARRASGQAPAAAPHLDPAGTSLAYGQFEQHTTGFGSRMLAKWGFQGQGSGLGRESQGRAEPLVASMRPKKAGLGTG